MYTCSVQKQKGEEFVRGEVGIICSSLVHGAELASLAHQLEYLGKSLALFTTNQGISGKLFE